MNKSFLILSIFCMMIANKNTVAQQKTTWPATVPPIAEKKEHVRDIHGDKVSDPYYWMIDYFKKGPDSNTVVKYLEDENAYLKTMMKSTEALQNKLFKEMKGRIKEKDESVPVFKKGYYYYTRTEEGKQYYKFCRKKGSLSAPEEVLLDVDEMAKGHAYFSASGFNISPDNNLLVFGEDTVSRRQYNMKVKDLKTGKIFDQGIKNTSSNYVWANDNRTIFYTANNPNTLLSEKIKRHILNSTPDKDVVVYEEKDNTNYIAVTKTRADNFLLIVSEATMSSEVRYLDANRPADKFKVFQPRMKDVLYEVDADDNAFFITTNKEALNFKLMKTSLTKTGVENWKELIPHRNNVLLQNVILYKDYIVLSEKKDALDQIRIINKRTGKDDYLPFDEPVYTALPTSANEYKSQVLRFNFTSLTTPSSVYDYNLITGKRVLKKQQPVLGGYNPKNYQSERVWVTASDGAKVPMDLVYKKGFEKNGKQPVFLYAYGSYGNSMNPGFSSNRISLLDRGFVYALAHIRGGQEMGRAWYEDGKMMRKKNTFTDFIDCGKYLVANKYTTPQHLYANGGSAGGLLMGAVANMAPDLFHGIIADVPFVDVVNTMLDPTIPLTTNEYDEWGNPENKDAYFYMKSYSPYENVEKKNYPNLLVTTGLHDSQVQYFEPAKWVAKLRDLKTDKNIVLLHTNMDFGHGGASGRFDYLKDVALMYAFVLKLEGSREN
jgi:oligopeptidase B